MITTKENTRTTWLGNFPTHWKVLRIKNLFQEIDERSKTGEEDLLSVSHYTGVTLKRENMENGNDYLTNAETLEGYKQVKQGDLVINIMLAWNGSLGISPFDGITSPAYCVYRIKGNNNSEYFGYLFSTSLFKVEFRRYSTGIIDSRLRLYPDKFFSIYSFVPSKDEQDEIVRYIKGKEEKINRFIQQKQQLIELLKEQRQSIINEAATKGINPNAKMKPSDIEWLGDIPEHWEVRRLRFLAKVNPIEYNYVFDDASEEYVVFLPMERVSELGNIDNSCKLPIKEISKGYTYFEKDDIVVAKITPCFENGKGAVLDDLETCFGFGTTEFHVLRCSDLVDKEFIYLLTSTFSFRKLGTSSMTGAAGQQRVPSTFIKNYNITYPTITEQKQIVEYIKTETAVIDTAIAKAEKEIELIKEYKKAIIAEAVMGKINIKSVNITASAPKREANWEFKEAVLISVLTDKFGSTQYPLGRKRYTKFSYLFHRYTDNKTEGYLHKAAGPYNPKTKYAGPEKIALQNKYVEGRVSGNYSGFVAGGEIQNAKNYFEKYWNIEALNWLEQFRKKTNDELELYTTVDKAMVELADNKKEINLQTVRQVIDEHPEWKPKLERDIFSDKNIAGAIEFSKQLFM